MGSMCDRPTCARRFLHSQPCRGWAEMTAFYFINLLPEACKGWANSGHLQGPFREQPVRKKAGKAPGRRRTAPAPKMGVLGARKAAPYICFGASFLRPDRNPIKFGVCLSCMSTCHGGGAAGHTAQAGSSDQLPGSTKTLGFGSFLP